MICGLLNYVASTLSEIKHYLTCNSTASLVKKKKKKKWKKGRKRSNNSSLFTLITKKNSSFFSPRTVTDILVLRKRILNYRQFSIYIQVIIFRLRQGILISILFNYANWDRAWKKNAVWKRERDRERERDRDRDRRRRKKKKKKKNLCSFYSSAVWPPAKRMQSYQLCQTMEYLQAFL